MSLSVARAVERGEESWDSSEFYDPTNFGKLSLEAQLLVQNIYDAMDESLVMSKKDTFEGLPMHFPKDMIDKEFNKGASWAELESLETK